MTRSDDGTNFTGADKELDEAMQNLNQAKIQEKMLKKEIQWIFNTPQASHQVWECQIRTVRKDLNSVLRQQLFDDDGLHTLLCEVESIINDRPLTKMSDDPNDLKALSLNHLLVMRKQASLPPGVFKKDDIYAKRRWICIGLSASFLALMDFRISTSSPGKSAMVQTQKKL